MVPTWALRLVLAGAVLVLIGAATPQGAVAVANVQYFLNFFAGVFALVALTIAVMSGLLATDRLILKIRHRVLAQALHRASAIVAVAMLFAHVSVKVMAGLAVPANIVIPTGGAVGLGTIAFDLLLVIVVTGMLRARFAFRGKAWVWRSIHALAYIAWPFAIVHGLITGRAAANWVVLSYVLSVVFVVLALVTRLIVVVKPRELNRVGDEIDPFTRPDGAGRRRDRRAMAAMEHEEARAAAAARAREAGPYDGYDDYGEFEDFDDPRGTVQDPRGMPVYGGGPDTEAYR
ncbi:hypothetical protein E1281_28685 [Actinomadura sp. KC345]|uniref:hypothetical protein n=1 Tax=Actinomadura sp. KC345 TaxID=2530371 RepID=UPI00104816B7|nr:hypothetical protein [Actinomadura sp. KC345]TDC46105.1 hypothetical protein E1281_28685 [Actinomadura sp. KC345]